MTHQENHQQQYHGRSSVRTSGKKALLVALTIATTCTAFQTQPPMMVASLGGSRSTKSSSSSSSKLNYAGTADTIRITTKTSSSRPVELKNIVPAETIDNHGYRVANHDNERCFWLHALENLEPSSSEHQSLWRRIAVANAPEQLIDTLASKIEQPHDNNDAILVRVGDTDLDIALAIPSESWDPSHLESKSVVSVTNDSRRDLHQVTIRVDFPEGSSFDKDAFTFEDELIAVIQQVRLLEKSANDKISSKH